jgi:putative membrane protein
MAVGAVVAGRLATPVYGVVALALSALGLTQALVVAEAAQRRYRSVRESLTTRGDLTAVTLGGAPLAALACSGVLTGVLTLAFVLDT